jgi:protein phosphatase
MKTEYFDSAEVSDVGRKRKNNEDACLCIPERGIYCVADGMGGQAYGDIASETIITTLQRTFSAPEAEADITFAKRIKTFRAAANEASKSIKDFADAKVVGQMGSTLAALLIDPHNPTRGVGLHAGDSRLYQFRNGILRQVTEDHSAVQALAQKLGIHPDQVPAKYQNELLRAVGLTESVELEKTPVEIASGDVFLLCSDGLNKMISDEIIAKMLKDGAQTPVQQLTQKFIDDANAAGGKDNVTVVLIRAGDLSKVPKVVSTEPEEEENTVGAEESATIATGVPAVDAGLPLPPDSGDIHGDTPTTPPPGDLPPVKDTRPKPEPATMVPPKKEMIFVPAATAEKKPSAPPPAGQAARPVQKNTSLFIALIGAAFLVAGAGAWLVFGPKPKPVENNPAPTNHPAVTGKILTTNPPAPSTNGGAATTAADKQRAYQTSLETGRAAFGKGDYITAISSAAAALQESPGDIAAAQLQAQAQTALQTQNAWRDAMKNAQAALDAKNYTNAMAWADVALGKIPNETGAMKLREQAAQQMAGAAAAAAAAENERKYSEAIAAGKAALDNNDPSAAIKSAQAALALRPGDATAGGIVQTSRTMMDMESARRFFDEADYDTTAEICQQHAALPEFKQLAEDCRTEQTALTNAKTALAAGDYATVAKLQPQQYARKAPFAAVLNQAADEQKLLAGLTALQSQNNWQALQQKISVPPCAPLAAKPPFLALAQWAQAQADQAARQKQAADLNVTYEEMLVWFNVKRPADPEIKTAQARKQSAFSGGLLDPQRQQYLGMVSMLETNFTRLGILNQDNRAKNLKELRDVISHHD